MELLHQRNKNFQTKQSIQAGRNFKPEIDDIFVATYPKCGTTWMTQILHGLRSNGDMSFSEITEVVPWDILALDCDQDVNDNQAFNPRIFKSHETFTDIAKSDPMCRYIFVSRNPYDAFVSFYNFLPVYFNIPLTEITMDEFASSIFENTASNSGTFGKFYMTWFAALKEHPKNIKWIFFEDMKNDLVTEIRNLINWLGFENISETKFEKVCNQASFSFMKANKDKFDDHFLFNKRKHAMGLSHVDKPGVAKVREGSTGSSNKSITPTAKELVTDDWKNNFLDETNITTYEELRKIVKEMQASA